MNETQRKAESADSVCVTHTLKMTVPDTWHVVPLETVLEDIVGGGTPSRGNPRYWNGPIPWLTVKDMRTHRPEDSIDHISEVAVRDSATNIIPADTVIIAARIGLGKVIRVPYDAAINQDLKALITKPTVDKSYLEYWIYSVASYLESIGSGTTVKGIRLEQIRSLPFPLAPLDQQKRIVAEIEKQFSRLDEAVADLKRVKANLKRYKAAVLKAAVEGRLVPIESNLWREMPLSELLHPQDVFNDGDWVESKDQDPDGEVRLIQLADIGDGTFRNRSNRFLTKAKAIELDCTFLKQGDILIARMPDPLGRACIFPGVEQESVTVVDVCIVRSPEQRYDNRWLMHTINSSGIRAQISALQAGSTRKRISRKNLSTIRLRVPPFAEQTRIAAEVERRLSVVEELEAAVAANLQRATCLRQSVLTRVFSG